MRITVMGKGKEIFVGMFDKKTNTLTKTVLSKDYVPKEKGYGIPVESLTQLTNLGCEKVHFCTETQTLEYPFSLILSRSQRSKDIVFVTIKEARIIKKEIKQPSWLRKG